MKKVFIAQIETLNFFPIHFSTSLLAVFGYQFVPNMHENIQATVLSLEQATIHFQIENEIKLDDKLIHKIRFEIH